MQLKEQFPEGRYWWMVSNPDSYKDWCLLDMSVGEEGGWNQRSGNGRDGRLRGTVDAFRAIRKGDWILGYMGGTTYQRGVYSLLKCTHALTKDDVPYYGFKKIRELDQCIPWEVFANEPGLKNARMVKMNNAGSLFGFTDKEQVVLLRLLRRFEKKARADRAELSKSMKCSEAARETMQRVGQNELRNYLLGTRAECAVTGLRVQSLLVASHIKDWSKCKKDERGDPENVLLLARNYDAAFDRKLISFGPDGKIVKSETVSWEDLAVLGIKKSARIARPRGKRAKYLEWHRAHLVKKAKA
jgi:hypothetical protein